MTAKSWRNGILATEAQQVAFEAWLQTLVLVTIRRALNIHTFAILLQLGSFCVPLTFDLNVQEY